MSFSNNPPWLTKTSKRKTDLTRKEFVATCMAIRDYMGDHGILIQDIMTKEDVARFELLRSEAKGRVNKGKELFANSKFAAYAELKQVATTDDFTALVKLSLIESMDAMRMPKVTSDTELQDRIVEYIEKCLERGSSPTFEEICLYCGFTVNGFDDMAKGKTKGFSPETKEIIQKTRLFIQNFDAKMVMAGKTNTIAYIFRAKNFYGMVDRVENVISTEADVSETYSTDDIESRYKDMGNVDNDSDKG